VSLRGPTTLRPGDAAPAVLSTASATPRCWTTDGVGVVGSRDISTVGSRVAREIAQTAVKSGLPVVSGAARGIDRDAMNGALEVGGQVVGVLA
jgi:predicted Rossmann fold nucleotide-binding protein DprA/Smf involved in DNA uptake